jgi:hypothetical protein
VDRARPMKGACARASGACTERVMAATNAPRRLRVLCLHGFLVRTTCTVRLRMHKHTRSLTLERARSKAPRCFGRGRAAYAACSRTTPTWVRVPPATRTVVGLTRTCASVCDGADRRGPDHHCWLWQRRRGRSAWPRLGKWSMVEDGRAHSGRSGDQVVVAAEPRPHTVQ